MSKTALLVQSDPKRGSPWAALLREADLEVFTATSGKEASNLLKGQGFDLIVINPQHAPSDGLAWCRELRSQLVNPILCLAPLHDDEHVLLGYEAGADECIPASIDPRVFLAKVRAWLRHSWTISTDALENLKAGHLQLQPGRRQVLLPDGSPVKLTNLEFRVLHLLMTHQSRVLSPVYILDRVWGYAGDEARGMLKNVIYRLRRKIESDPAHPHHIKTMPGDGYVFQRE